MRRYALKQWDTLPHHVITLDTDQYPSFIDYAEAEDDECFDTILDKSKIESNGTFDAHVDYVDRTLVQYTNIYYFDTNTYGLVSFQGTSAVGTQEVCFNIFEYNET